ncbi:MAG: hypothetical protein R3231_07345, partial [bacterium]|nr:hypothetical protein [bacterium]
MLLMGPLMLLQGPLSAEATALVDLLEAGERLDLGSHPDWLKLLHYERDGSQSEILTETFFLSATGRQNPQSELAATIEAYLEPWESDTDSHPRCQYPARYFWLSQHLPLPDYRVREPRCGRLEKWALFDRVQ